MVGVNVRFQDLDDFVVLRADERQQRVGGCGRHTRGGGVEVED